MNLESSINLDDLRKLAKRRLPKVIYDFIEGGADDEQGLRTNEAAFQRRALVPKYLVDVSDRDQSTELFGRRYDSPFGIAPTGGISNYRRGGDLMLAAAAREANAAHDIEQVGEKLRAMMPWIAANKIVDKAKN